MIFAIAITSPVYGQEENPALDKTAEVIVKIVENAANLGKAKGKEFEETIVKAVSESMTEVITVFGQSMAKATAEALEETAKEALANFVSKEKSTVVVAGILEQMCGSGEPTQLSDLNNKSMPASENAFQFSWVILASGQLQGKAVSVKSDPPHSNNKVLINGSPINEGNDFDVCYDYSNPEKMVDDVASKLTEDARGLISRAYAK